MPDPFLDFDPVVSVFTPPQDKLSVVEVRAWARASSKIAHDEGFGRTGAAVDEWIGWFDDLLISDVTAVHIVPCFASGNTRTCKRLVDEPIYESKEDEG